MKVGILGAGQIGRSIFEVYQEKQPQDKIMVRDLYINDLEEGLDVLHVALPGDLENFVDLVKENQSAYHPGVTIIHSTVPVGTTKQIPGAVHAPVRGVHPNLKEGILTFVMYIGANDPKARDLAEQILTRLDIPISRMDNSDATELAKMASTTYYGVCIAYHAYMKKLCDQVGVSFVSVINDWNSTYNAGYTRLGKQNVVRPVLYPPPDDIIGGHCVVENAELLEEQFGDDPILSSILRHKKRVK